LCRRLCFLVLRHAALPSLFPYTTLFRSSVLTKVHYDLVHFDWMPFDNRRLFAEVSRKRHFVTQGDLQQRHYVSQGFCDTKGFDRDRKSTRLNSSHVKTSYAVFCLKKKMM